MCYGVANGFHIPYLDIPYMLQLFKSVYCHRVAKSIEYMITDALVEADVVWRGRLSKAVDDPKDFLLLTDCVLREIESSQEAAMKKACAWGGR